MTRYVLWPGEVISRSDGDRHYIGVGRLLDLYRVPPSARYIVGTDSAYRSSPGDVQLRPRRDGDYPLLENSAARQG